MFNFGDKVRYVNTKSNEKTRKLQRLTTLNPSEIYTIEQIIQEEAQILNKIMPTYKLEGTSNKVYHIELELVNNIVAEVTKYYV